MMRRLVALALTVSATMAAHPASVLYQFDAPSLAPYAPISGVIYDGRVGLFGVTERGGAFNEGAVYRLTPNAPGTSWTLTDVHDFGGAGDGAFPVGGLLLGSNGIVYGTTAQGGASALGTVFELDPKTGAEQVLHSFSGADGNSPQQRLTADASGALYGVTRAGGSTSCRGGCGVLFKIVPPEVLGGAASETSLHLFAGEADGGKPSSPVLIDSSGNLYLTVAGRFAGRALMFTASDGWQAHVLHNFATEKGDGHNPSGPIAMDSSGALYGSLATGGPITVTASGRRCSTGRAGDGRTGCGSVYKLTPPAVSGGSWTEALIFNFGSGTFPDGVFPTGATFDASGNLFGVAQVGGDACPDSGLRNTGTIFELSPPPSGEGSWIETATRQNLCSAGFTPSPDLLITPQGGIYGTFGDGPRPTGAGSVFFYKE